MDEAASIINIIGTKLEFQGEYARLEGNILNNDWRQMWKKVKKNFQKKVQKRKKKKQRRTNKK